MFKLSVIWNHYRWFFLFSAILIFATYKIPTEFMFAGDALYQYVHASQIGFSPIPKIDIQCSWMYPVGSCDLTSFDMLRSGSDFLSPFSYSVVLIKAILLKIFPATSIIYLGLSLFLVSCYLILKNGSNNPNLMLVLLVASPLLFHALGFLDVAISNFFILLAMLRKTADWKKVSFLSLSSWFRIETLIFSTLYLFFEESSLRKRVKNIGLLFLIYSLYGLGNYYFYGTFLGQRVSSNLGGMLNLFSYDRLQIMQSLLFFGNARVGFLLYCVYFLPFYFYFLFQTENKKERSKIIVLSLAIILTVLFSPNDSNIDWGTRYLSHFVVITFVYLKDLDFKIYFADRIKKYTTLVLIFISLVISFNYYRLYQVSAKQIKKFQEVFLFANSKNLIFNNQFLANHSGLDVLSRRYILAPNQNDDWILLQKKLKEHEDDVTFIFFDIDTSLNEMIAPILNHQTQSNAEILTFLERDYIKKEEISKHNVRGIHFIKRKTNL